MEGVKAGGDREAYMTWGGGNMEGRMAGVGGVEGCMVGGTWLVGTWRAVWLRGA